MVKKNVLTLLITVAAVLFCGGYVFAEESDALEIYVAVDGNDSNAGTINAPLKTLDGARLKAREIKKQGKPVNVIFRGGVYPITKTTVFSTEDSGTPDAPITYKAYEGEDVVFSGAKTLDASQFKLVTDEKILSRLYENVRGKIYELDLGRAGVADELINWTAVRDMEERDNSIPTTSPIFPPMFYLNDSQQQVARFPNSGYIDTYKVVRQGAKFNIWNYAEQDWNNTAVIAFKEQTPLRWENAENAFIRGNFAYAWYKEEAPLKSIDAENRTLTLGSHLFNLPTTAFNKNGWYAFNLIEELDLLVKCFLHNFLDFFKIFIYE